MSNQSARDLAVKAFAEIKPVPTSLITYRSAGSVIAIGESQQLEQCDRLPAAISIERIATDSAAGRIEISGHLGAFEIRLEDAQGKSSSHKADVLLDFHQAALLQRGMLPPGYFHLASDSWDAAALGEELQELVGEFEKPRYFNYDASICAHGVNGKIACRLCIDACPAEAISSLVERIEVDPFLCQGGGSCAAVCPSGAITYAYPSIRDQGKRLKKLLQVYHAEAGEQAMVMFYPRSASAENYCQTHHNLLAIEVEELGSVGMEMCLSALAYGASQVLLLVDEQVPPLSLEKMEAQLTWVKALLSGLGIDQARISSCSNTAEIPLCDAAPATEAAIYDMPDDKRNAIFQALDHLINCLKPTLQEVELPQPAPFGEAVIDPQKCTLCMACVGACPGRALQDGSNRAVPEVFFIENKCLQCNACVLTCPEDAITLQPRMLFDRELRNRSRSLNSDTPFACIACGKAFAPTSVINKMQEKLKDHYMFANQRALDRLKMCEDCRVVDIVDDPEALGGQFDPLGNFRQ